MRLEGNFSSSNPPLDPQLHQLLTISLTRPSADLEHTLLQLHPQRHLNIILQSQYSADIRKAACSVLRSQVQQRETFLAYYHNAFQAYYQYVLGQIENIYVNGDDSISKEIQGSLQLIIEQIFKVYLDDQSKISAFQLIMQRVTNNDQLINLRNSVRLLKIAKMLLGTTHPATINNQVWIGQLICLLKQIYYPQNNKGIQGSINGRGQQLMRLTTNMSNTGQNTPTLDPNLRQFVLMQLQTIKIMRQIIQRVQDEQDSMEQPDNIPKAYLANSNQIQSLITGVLLSGSTNRIFTPYQLVNYLKAQTIQLYTDQYIYHPNKPLLNACLQTIVNTNTTQIIDQVDTIISQVLKILQRSTSHSQYSQDFYQFTQVLILKLMEFVVAGSSQRRIMEEDPEQFVNIADDFCKTQENQSFKIRTGSLIYNLCLSIDGNLTFVIKLALISLYSLQKKSAQKFLPASLLRKQAIQGQKQMQTFMSLWSKTPQDLTQSSLLILSCISDLISKRSQIQSMVRNHLQIMLQVFTKDSLGFFPCIILCRYIQILSYFSCVGCLDPLLRLYTAHKVYQSSIMTSLQNIIHYHNKKSPEMCMYVARLTTTALLMGKKLTPLLQKTIVDRPELILCVKQRLLQKLINWFMDYYQTQNIFGCNKISNLLIKVIQQYPKYTVRGGMNIDMETLVQYMAPVYKSLTHKQHPAEECIVDMAIAHIQACGVQISQGLAQQFMAMAVQVTQNNKGVLNKCLQLLSRLMSIPNMNKITNNAQAQGLKNVQVGVARQLLPRIVSWLPHLQRPIDTWQMLTILQYSLLLLPNQSISLDILLNIFSQPLPLLKIKSLMVLMISAAPSRCPSSQLLSFIAQYPFNYPVPPYQRNFFTIYLIRMIPAFGEVTIRARLVQLAIGMIYPDQAYSKYLQDYQQKLYLVREEQIQIDALHTSKELSHPLSSQGADVFLQFKIMMEAQKQWQEMRNLLRNSLEVIRDILGRQVVGGKARRILKIKR